ncbi:MAG TPA: Amuc_1102 family pilus-like protein [Chthoniobacterales bacterium]|nr:Amuc_1102 family pilus-like protein [Chthoniobacterales bacterium]
MKFLGIWVLGFGISASAALAQTRGGGDFQLLRITKNLVSTPQISYTGGQQYPANQRDRWLEVEVEFAAAPDYTDELTFKYFILINGKLLAGEVTHVNIAAGRENRSVMYVSPRSLARFNGNRPVAPNMVQNVAIQLLQQGAVKDEMSFARAPGQWYAGLAQLTGFVLNKNETPFAPLYWDRYEQIKSR